MPRYRRLFLPDFPLHIVHRGHDRKPVFVQESDYRFYLDNLKEMKKALNIRVFAYCLMTNHVHLIVVPGAKTENVSTLLRVIAARQTRHVNKLERRSGTLWEGRFKSSLIDSDAYLLACCRYVELNPVRAAIVATPEQYAWSSYRQRIGIADNTWIDHPEQYCQLGSTAVERTEAYRSFVADGIPERQLSLIRAAAQRNQLTGSDHFRRELERRTGRRLSNKGQGRPRLEK